MGRAQADGILVRRSVQHVSVAKIQLVLPQRPGNPAILRADRRDVQRLAKDDVQVGVKLAEPLAVDDAHAIIPNDELPTVGGRDRSSERDVGNLEPVLLSGLDVQPVRWIPNWIGVFVQNPALAARRFEGEFSPGVRERGALGDRGGRAEQGVFVGDDPDMALLK